MSIQVRGACRRAALAAGIGLILLGAVVLALRLVMPRQSESLLAQRGAHGAALGQYVVTGVGIRSQSHSWAKRVESVHAIPPGNHRAVALAPADRYTIFTEKGSYYWIPTTDSLLVNVDESLAGGESLELRIEYRNVPRVQAGWGLMTLGALLAGVGRLGSWMGWLGSALERLQRRQQGLAPYRGRAWLWLSVLVGAAVLVIALTQDRGLDNDGAHSLFWLRRPEGYVTTFLYPWVLHPLFRALGGDVVMLRLVLLAAVAGGLAVSILLFRRRVVREDSGAPWADWRLVFLFLSAVVLAYVDKKTNVSYNDVAMLGVVLGVGCTYPLRSAAAGSLRVMAPWAVALGMCGALVFAGRPPGAGLFLTLACASLLPGEGRLGRRALPCLFAAVGLAAGVALLTVPFGAQDIFANIAMSLKAGAKAGYAVAGLFDQLKRVVKDLSSAALLAIGAYAVLLALLRLAPGLRRWLPALSVVLACAVTAALGPLLGEFPWRYFFGLGGEHSGYRSGAAFFVLLAWLLCDLACAKLLRLVALSREQWAEIALLALLPCCIALGSSDAPLSYVLYFIYPWLLLYARLGGWTAALPWGLARSWALPAVLGSMVMLSFADGYVLLPRNNNVPLWEIDSPAPESFRGGNLKVPRFMGRAAEDIHDLLTRRSDFRPGDVVLGLYDMPELLYLISAESPTYVPYRNNPVMAEYACTLLDILDTRFDRPFLLLSEPMNPSLLACLRARGVDFPSGYRLVGSTAYSYLGVEPRQVEVYVPVARLR